MLLCNGLPARVRRGSSVTFSEKRDRGSPSVVTIGVPDCLLVRTFPRRVDKSADQPYHIACWAHLKDLIHPNGIAGLSIGRLRDKRPASASGAPRRSAV